MTNKIYVANMAYSTTNETLHSLFKEYGTVLSAELVRDRESGQNKGIAFVQMSSGDEAMNAVLALDNKPLDGRIVKVSLARATLPSTPQVSEAHKAIDPRDQW